MTFRQVSGFTAAVLVGAALLVPARASAQGVTIGVKGGLNTSNVKLDSPSGESLPNTDTLNGLIIGGFVGRDFNAKAGMVVEFLWARAGSNLNFVEDGIQGALEIKVDYFQVPVLARANFRASDKAVVHVFGGPTFGFKTGKSEKVTANGIDVSQDVGEQADLKSNDMGLTIGAGFDIGQFLVDARYTWGLMNINNESSGDPKVKTQQFAVMFGMELWRK